ncbi:hypothetical protein JKP88DRAFT_333194 [Tribonema minus]|uniref:Pentatricopeptide repeat-containing protein n=1 Tax=Tribonema minus TaxID=303371 RepID=A0A835YL26_9STRA|nr:hypothetical protein JKP88DRAFT_333194 [Tribonema minus]
MVKCGHRPHISLFHLVLEAVAAKREAREAWRVLALMRQSGTKPDVTAYNWALRSQITLQSADSLLKEFQMVDAGVAPGKVTDPSFVNVHMWNMLLHAIIASGNPQSALQKAAEMTQRGLAPDAVTHSLLLAAHAALGDQTEVDSLVSQMSASGVEIAPAYHRWVIEGYAQGGLMLRAEDTLEAALMSGTFHPDMAIALLWKYSKAGNLSRVLFWLQRLSALGHKLHPGMWSAAIDAAHKAGDTDTADALWRDAEAAGGMRLYKEMRRTSRGGGWHMVRDKPPRSRDAGSTVLDVTICGVGVALAALRAEAHDLRNKSPSAFRYVFMGTRMPLLVKNEVIDGMHELGLQVSEVPGAAYFYKIAVLATQR